MGWSSLNYRDQLMSLLPKGRFWTRGITSVLRQLFYGKGEELARVDTKSEDLILESFPLKASDTLADWEEEFGITEEDVQVTTSNTQRREQINAKLIATGGQNKEYYEDIATSLEYDISIAESTPAWAGIAEAGDPCGDLNIIFKWIVYILTANLVKPRQVNISRIYFEIDRTKPGHTQMFMDFYGEGFSRGFSDGFEAIPWFDNSWGADGELAFDGGFSNGFANNVDYDGIYLIGGFGKGFSIGFDRRTGGAFEYDGFSFGFDQPI
jgi:uncharacterized protein YmfQ (DUF2313 family)